MLNWMKAVLLSLVIAVNQLMTALVFFLWLSCNLYMSHVFILSSIGLLVFPISDFERFINQYVGLVLKLGL